MKLFYVIMFIFIFSLQLYSIDSLYKIELLDKYSKNNNDIIALVFLNYGSCVKCIIYPEKILIEAKTTTNIYFITIGMIYCNRVKELHNFKKIYNWNYNIEPDLKGLSRKKIGCKYDTDICFLDNKGSILLELKISSDYKENLKKIISILNSHIKKIKKENPESKP